MRKHIAAILRSGMIWWNVKYMLTHPREALCDLEIWVCEEHTDRWVDDLEEAE
jgi:hypothetical protein